MPGRSDGRDDVEAHCPGTELGIEWVRCLREHESELSEGCRESVERRRSAADARGGTVRAACAADAEVHCSGTEPGAKRLRCLHEHEAELSEACRTRLAKRRARSPSRD